MARLVRKEPSVTTVLLRCRVAAFDAWRPGYEESTAARPEVLSYRLWRGAEDPNLVIRIETCESREVVDALVNPLVRLPR